jgi:hypothetical protein
LQEFFHQSDVEKQEGLPYAAFMDRDKVTKGGAQGIHFLFSWIHQLCTASLI